MGSSPFHIAKAHARHRGSPTQQQINAMLAASKVIEVENILANTRYGDLLEIARPSVNLTEFEVAMKRDFAALLHLFQKTAPTETSELLRDFSLIIEAENMDLILQAIIRDNVTPELKQNIIPVGKFGMEHYERMIEVTSVHAATDFIIDPTLRKAAQDALNISDDPDDQIYHLSSALSHTSFLLFNQVAPKWIRKEIEFYNIETICRAVAMGFDPKTWLIPGRDVVNRFLPQLTTMKTAREILTFIQPYASVPKLVGLALGAEDDELVSKFEDIALNYLYARRYRDFFIYGNRKEAMLDFFSILRAEVEDITRILFSKEKNIDPEVISNMLYPVYSRR